jgi:hypothetical protein
MDPIQYFQRISTSLSSTVATKVKVAAPAFAGKAKHLATADGIAAAAIGELRYAFSAATPMQLNALAFYMVARVIAAGGLSVSPDEITAKLNSMSGAGEMDQLRFQIYMDRHAKALETLSNLLKKISDTSSSIVQNLK